MIRHLKASVLCAVLLLTQAAAAGCSIPGKVTSDDIALAKLGVETAVQSVSNSAESIAKREDRPITVILALFPDLVNHKFGAFNDLLQDKRNEIHLYIDTKESSTR